MSTTATTKARRTVAPKTTPPVLNLGADLSPAVKALEEGYRIIQAEYPSAPAVTVVVKRDARAWGHTTVDPQWTAATSDGETATHYEVMISGENLRRGAEAVAATLLHEAAHAINLASGVRDCDVNGRHNTKFRDQAQAMGLDVAEYGWHGWTLTTLSDEGRTRWAALLARLDEGLNASAVAIDPSVLVVVPPAAGGAPTAGPVAVAPPKRTGRRNLIKAVCTCGHSIRASQTVLDNAKPLCAACGQQFVAQD